MRAGSSTSASSLKSTPPTSLPITGMIRSSTSADTILPKAAPSTTPTARSSTLPRIANSLNSEIIPITASPSVGEDLAGKLDQAVDAGTEAVAWLQCRDAARRTHVDQVAGAQRVQPRQVSQHLRHAEDHVGQRRLLAQLAVYF